MKKNYRFLFWIIIALILVPLGLKIFYSFSRSVWDGKQRINFVIENSRINLVSYSPTNQELTLITLPDELLLNVPRGYGEFTARALPKLVSQEKRPELLKETIQENFAVPVDGWINVSNFGKENNPRNRVTDAFIAALKLNGLTNLSDWDLIRFWWAARAVRSSNIQSIDLSDYRCLVEGKLPDGTPIFKLNQEMLDSVIQKYFPDDSLRASNLTVQILNGTDHSGLGQSASRILTNMGIKIIDVGNMGNGIEKCEVRGGEELKNSYIVKKISGIFNCDWLELTEKGRSDIIVVIGENYWRKLNIK
ncbi:hypothetical protein COT44_00040 [Candidatus Shapirobacteria bacterium CG08_land_8_20_14_0_20_39_18]|uniref:LytR/CpsA/Psr regulator C-terminal domain-containing protein n=1 Tax=Candidatus Shapirobacteria bacterium CG08_land_8_20_14_0_20_39_18 TaxID=1974883 RepID=A0A2M6XEA9_9BACT|nr:MAG: hypothetical protein COT44_00040 [Candidatus Shapirobacteria bacterium CG08_land_8_20_14_0_20_39_18]PIY66091.1 MAG: hypothetical protein COY91_01310 [Candidatus Shapirobacteria bacterium CG_4_10_14_0_8_um_filter_39_15]PJE68646.1 MAG: hypothetical protein COU94_00865 [Candidatus Shapirobacteria bacterium CG10_big_fil_rev_8_21_14_0_10_38_8]